MILSPEMETHFRQRFGSDFQAFVEAIKQPPSLSVRLNPAKAVVPDFFQSKDPVPWAKNSCYLPSRPLFYADPLHHAGAYYVQEASSMFFANAIDFSKDLRVLDLCAAPGGKSTLLLNHLSPNSLLVSNELDIQRNAVLVENLNRWGNPNVVVTQAKAEQLAPFTGTFDVVLVDAPCSGEGMFRKDKRTVEQWSPRFVERCNKAQHDILQTAPNLVKPGGLLLYSTCTYESVENEALLGQVLQNHPAFSSEPIMREIPDNWGIETRHFSNKLWGYYLYFHKVRGEGQFVAALRKEGEADHSPKNDRTGNWQLDKREHSLQEVVPETYKKVEFKQKIHAIPTAHAGLIETLAERLTLWKMGTMLGQWKHLDFVPTHEFALSHWQLQQAYVRNVEIDEALAFLQKKPISHSGETGIFLAAFQGLPLGWYKAVKGRVNNKLPKEYVLRKVLT